MSKNNKNILCIISILYFLCFLCSILMSNSVLIAAEHLTTNDPGIILNNLINNYDWVHDSLVKHSSLPRGFHQGIINNVLFYTIVYIGKIIGLNATFTQIFFGFSLQIIGLFLLIDCFDCKIRLIDKLLISSIYMLNYQNVELILGGGFFLVNNGLLLLISSITLNYIINGKNDSTTLFIIAVISAIFFYSGIVWINIGIIIFISLFFLSIYFNINFNWKILIFFLLFLVLVIPYAYYIYEDPIPFYWSAPPQDIIFSITSGFFKVAIFKSKYANFILSMVILSFILYIFIADYKYKKRFWPFLAFLILVIWQISPLGNWIMYNVPLFHNFRATYKLSIITTILIIYCIISIYEKSKYVKYASLFFVVYQIIYISVDIRNYSLINIPNEYYAAQKYLNEIKGRKLLLPYSNRNDFIGNTYSWIGQNSIYRQEYPSNLFASIIPVDNIIDVDEVDNPSYSRLDIQKDLLINKGLTYDLLQKYSIGYIIYDGYKSDNNNINISDLKYLTNINQFGKIIIYKFDVNNKSSKNIYQFQKERVSFFKSNIGVHGLSDYVSDAKVINRFLLDGINPYPIFELKIYDKSKIGIRCFNHLENIKSLSLYNIGQKGIPSKVLVNDFVLTPKYSGTLEELYEFNTSNLPKLSHQFCIESSSREPIYFSLQFKEQF